MENMGWELITGPDEWNQDGLSGVDSLFKHPEKKGVRGTTFMMNKFSTREGGAWAVSLASIHPDRHALCRHKRQQGL
jgi:hypothetical protein